MHYSPTHAGSFRLRERLKSAFFARHHRKRVWAHSGAPRQERKEWTRCSLSSMCVAGFRHALGCGARCGAESSADIPLDMARKSPGSISARIDRGLPAHSSHFVPCLSQRDGSGQPNLKELHTALKTWAWVQGHRQRSSRAHSARPTRPRFCRRGARCEAVVLG